MVMVIKNKLIRIKLATVAVARHLKKPGHLRVQAISTSNLIRFSSAVKTQQRDRQTVAFAFLMDEWIQSIKF